MPLFECTKCHAVDNTALAENFWWDTTQEGKPALCSACDPQQAAWHGRFEKITESGPGARPCDVAWIRSIVEQCKAAGVACFVKQLGAFCVGPSDDWVGHRVVGPVATGNGLESRMRIVLDDPKGGDINEFPADLRVREYPASMGRSA